MNDKETGEIFARINARLKTLTFRKYEPCFLCGSPSQGFIVAEGQAVRSCVKCACLTAEMKFDAGEDIALEIPGNRVILYSHVGQKEYGTK